MRQMKLRALILIAAIALSGCRTSHPTEQEDPISKGGAKWSEAHQKAAELRTGVSCQRVREVFGEPNTKVYLIAGQQTAKPWDAVTWTYTWHFTRDQYNKPYNVFLTVMFQRTEKTDEGVLRDFQWSSWPSPK
jgi:outer membrane protein assembly factor BamE (lipoprotein component of BamABCDE complex)